MTAPTRTHFDFDLFRRSLEEWDVDTLLGLYADDVEHVEMDDATPPGAPRIRNKHDLAGSFQHCHDARVKLTLENPVIGDERVAYTLSCHFDGGRRVVSNAILELRDGKIVRELDVAARDL